MKQGPAEAAGPQAQRLSLILNEIADDARWERVTVGDLVDRFDERAFGALMLILAAPNVIPLPVPAASVVSGVPLVVLALQLIAGRHAPWLPVWIRRRSLPRADFAAMVARVDPWFGRVERYLRPRLDTLFWPATDRVIGVTVLVSSLLLFVPIPFGQMLPGVAIVLLALGLLERDGMVLLLGGVTALTGLVVSTAILYGLGEAAIHLFGAISAFW